MNNTKNTSDGNVMESFLSRRLGISDVKRVVAWSREHDANRELLWRYTFSKDRRVSVNALWALTHLPESDKEWLQSLQNELADKLIVESDGSKKRLMLQLLRDQKFNPENIRTDLLDFCLSKINSECEPYAVRCFSMYLAYNLSQHYPELIEELERYLDLLSMQSLSAGLKSGLRQTQAKIAHLKRIKKNTLSFK